MNNCSPWIHEIYQEIFEICTDLGILVVNAKYAQQYTVAYTRFFAQCQEQVMVVMTRAKAKQQLEEELIRKEKELLSGAQSNTLVRVNEPVACDNVVPSRSESEAGQADQQSPRKNSKLTKERSGKRLRRRKSHGREAIQSIRT